MISKPITVFTTTDSQEEARKLAETVVGKKLAACAQITEIETFYTWKNEVQNESEFRILFKTTRERYKDLKKAILELHSYDLPAIFAVDIDNIHEPFGEWIADNSREN